MKDIKIHLDGHSVFSPSSSEMWLNCAGSLLANLKIRQEGGDSGSEPAAEGTVAHEMAEIWLKTGKKPIQHIGEVRKVGKFDIEVTDEMLMYVADYVNWCNGQDGDKFVEVKVDFSHLTPIENQTGTSDHVCCSQDKLTITDLKYGMGVRVDAENNTQLQIYALGVLNDYGFLYDFKTVEMRICQPRLNHFSTWEIPVEQLLEFGEYVKQKAREAWQDNAPRKTSYKGCLWCRVKAQCPEQAKQLESLVDDAFAELTDDEVKERIDKDEFMSKLPEIQELNMAQVEKIYSKIKSVESFLKAIEDKMLDFALKGGKMNAYKLVNGRSARTWIDESVVGTFFNEHDVSEDDYSPRKLVSPAQAEKICKSKGLSFDGLTSMIRTQTGKPTIAPLTDKRSEYAIDVGVDW